MQEHRLEKLVFVSKSLIFTGKLGGTIYILTKIISYALRARNLINLHIASMYSVNNCLCALRYAILSKCNRKQAELLVNSKKLCNFAA